jgi:hypothetical protein
MNWFGIVCGLPLAVLVSRSLWQDHFLVGGRGAFHKNIDWFIAFAGAVLIKPSKLRPVAIIIELYRVYGVSRSPAQLSAFNG